MFLIKGIILPTLSDIWRDINWLNNRKEMLSKEELLKGRYLFASRQGKPLHSRLFYPAPQHNL